MIIRPLNAVKRPLILGSLVVGTSLALLAIPAAAQADPGPTGTGTVQAHVTVASAITLTNLTPAFTLSGIPGQTVSTATPVTMTVTTNNTQGYTVTVQSATAALAGAISGNTNTIPIADLQVRETGTTPYTSLSDATAVTVHSQTAPSAETGDAVSNDFSMTIPFVAQDTYTTTLNYVAATV